MWWRKTKATINEGKRYRIWDLRLKIHQMDHCSRLDLFSIAFAYDAQCDFTIASFVFRELPCQMKSVAPKKYKFFFIVMITVLWLLSLTWHRHPQPSALIARLMLVPTSDDYRNGMGKDDGSEWIPLFARWQRRPKLDVWFHRRCAFGTRHLHRAL